VNCRTPIKFCKDNIFCFSQVNSNVSCTKNTVFAYYLIGNGTLDDHVADILVDKSFEIDAIMDDSVDNYENKNKAELILAQIQDKIRSK